jgi:hypothetical protein
MLWLLWLLWPAIFHTCRVILTFLMGYESFWVFFASFGTPGFAQFAKQPQWDSLPGRWIEMIEIYCDNETTLGVVRKHWFVLRKLADCEVPHWGHPNRSWIETFGQRTSLWWFRAMWTQIKWRIPSFFSARTPTKKPIVPAKVKWNQAKPVQTYPNVRGDEFEWSFFFSHLPGVGL